MPLPLQIFNGGERMAREPIEVTRQDRIYCLKASSDYHSELCEECRFYPNCDHVTQDDMTEITIKDLETLEQKPCEDAVSVTSVFEIMGNLLSIPYDFDRNITEKDVSESMDKIRELPRVTLREQRKGHWVKEESICGWDGRSYQCSECGRSIHLDTEMEDLEDYPYCHCGAKMQEVKE